jgi:malonyl-CoA decarboxylase
MGSHPASDRRSRLLYQADRARTVSPPTDVAADVGQSMARCHDLLSEYAFPTAIHLANNVMAGYTSLPATGRAAFFDRLVQDFSPDPVALRHAAESYIRCPDEVGQNELRRAGESPRRDLFLRLNESRGGTAFLVRMREHLLQGLRDHPSWEVVEDDLTQVLKPVFGRPLLEFQQIDWDTPAPILEKLMQYEAVHAIHGWRDMRRRLDADRRCYALFHPAWPDEPLIFTEVALTVGISRLAGPLLDPDSPVLDPDACDAAILYSISSCQPGLRGFGLGNDLTSRVAEDLRIKSPRLKVIATLSPVPGFRSWLSGLSRTLENPAGVAEVLTVAKRSDWRSEPAATAALQHPLLSLCAHYLLHASSGNEPADPVARFHLANGARLRRLNWRSDMSAAGLEQSFGLTANYVYYPTNLSRNCQTYHKDRRVNATRELERLARSGADLCGPPLRKDLPISA